MVLSLVNIQTGPPVPMLGEVVRYIPRPSKETTTICSLDIWIIINTTSNNTDTVELDFKDSTCLQESKGISTRIVVRNRAHICPIPNKTKIIPSTQQFVCDASLGMKTIKKPDL
jgi:hypothetical protein